jgi:Zn-finger nucleic acid-binding protein
METVRLHQVPIDRCTGHGVWFDRGELATVLLRYAPPPQ